MIRTNRTTAIALGSLLFMAVLGACTPVPGKSDHKAEAKPEDICKHVREIANKDSDDADVLDQVERDCVDSLASLQTRYRIFAECVELATDGKAIADCEKDLAKPRSLLARVGPQAKVEALCSHIIAMFQEQLGDATGQMGAGELDSLRDQCMADATKQLEVQGIETFTKEADCILAAQTLEQLQACGL